MTHADDLATLDRLLADKNMTLEEAEAVGRVKQLAGLGALHIECERLSFKLSASFDEQQAPQPGGREG